MNAITTKTVTTEDTGETIDGVTVLGRSGADGGGHVARADDADAGHVVVLLGGSGSVVRRSAKLRHPSGYGLQPEGCLRLFRGTLAT